MPSRRRIGTLARYSSLTVVASISLVFILVALSQSARAGTQPLYVWGKVVDAAGNPISGASVSVTDIQTSVVRYDSDGTDSAGIYAIDSDFAPSDYNVGDTLRVDVSSTLGPKSNTTVVTQAMDDGMEAIIWVEYDTMIPEFGTAFGAIVAAFAVGLVCLVVLERKRN